MDPPCQSELQQVRQQSSSEVLWRQPPNSIFLPHPLVTSALPCRYCNCPLLTSPAATLHGPHKERLPARKIRSRLPRTLGLDVGAGPRHQQAGAHGTDTIAPFLGGRSEADPAGSEQLS